MPWFSHVRFRRWSFLNLFPRCVGFGVGGGSVGVDRVVKICQTFIVWMYPKPPFYFNLDITTFWRLMFLQTLLRAKIGENAENRQNAQKHWLSSLGKTSKLTWVKCAEFLTLWNSGHKSLQEIMISSLIDGHRVINLARARTSLIRDSLWFAFDSKLNHQ